MKRYDYNTEGKKHFIFKKVSSPKYVHPIFNVGEVGSYVALIQCIKFNKMYCIFMLKII